jgi:hypothetical protein
MEEAKEVITRLLAEVLSDDPFAFACARLSHSSVTITIVGADKDRATSVLRKYCARVITKRDSLIAILPLR